ncbi:MAG: protein-disulfide reductase DsbD family protein [Bacteroidota bacterium]
MIRLISLFLSLLLFSISSYSQIYDPVDWSFSYEEKGDNSYDLVFTATIEDGSHLYSMHLPDGGPIPTSFTFEESDNYEPVGETREMNEGEIVFDRAFEMEIKYFRGVAEFRQTASSNLDSFDVNGYITYMACDDERCSPPRDQEFKISIAGGDKELEQTATAINDTPADKRGLIGLFLVSFLLGMAAIVTPCVFPMIPMTVAFFSRGTENKGKSFIQALIFALSIVIIYSSLGIIVSLTSAGAGFANALSTHWIPNIIFFLLFVVFAASFFGAYEIILPNKWVSSADARVDRGGMIAAFFLGLTTVLVSFACTGPIVGALLVEAATGHVLRPTVGMSGFGLGFALPFFLFALFPAVIKKLPRSGGWLNSVKVVLAFLMLAFSMKFLSTIDEVYGLNILTRDIYLAIWIVLFTLLGLYLMGKIKFAHDSEVPHIGIFRLLLIIAVFSFAVYLLPGLFGAPLKGISGMLPPRSSAKFDLSQEVTTKQVAPAAIYDTAESALCSEPRYADKFELPYGLTGYFDLEQGLACAKEKNMPVFIDFKGHACSNCKELEARVWSDPEVLKRLRNNFVIIALYCDDRTRLPESEWIVSDIDGKVKKTIGQANTNHEIEMFGTNTQPLYAITDAEGNPLVDPMAFNLDVDEYIEWLDKGLENF